MPTEDYLRLRMYDPRIYKWSRDSGGFAFGRSAPCGGPGAPVAGSSSDETGGG